MSEKFLSDFRAELAKVTEHLKTELNSIRANRAHPSIIENIRVDAYGSKMPINQLASVNAPEADLLVIQPWDASIADAIVKAINAGGLGFNATKDTGVIRIKLPALSADRRLELTKAVHVKGEEAQVSVRNVRHKFVEELENLGLSEDEEFRIKRNVDDLTKEYSDLIHTQVQTKESELVTI